MSDNFEALQDLSEQFLRSMIDNQKKLREVRRKQFQKMHSNTQRLNFDRIRASKREILQREAEQISLIVKEMDKILTEKLDSINKKKSFADKEIEQEKIILSELEKEISESTNDADFHTYEFRSSLVPTLLHLDMLYRNSELNEKQKNHLGVVRKNIFSYIKNSADEEIMNYKMSLKDGQNDAFWLLAHEIKASFVPILDDVDMLLSPETGALNEKQAEKVRKIKANLKSINRFITDLSKSMFQDKEQIL